MCPIILDYKDIGDGYEVTMIQLWHEVDGYRWSNEPLAWYNYDDERLIYEPAGILEHVRTEVPRMKIYRKTNRTEVCFSILMNRFRRSNRSVKSFIRDIAEDSVSMLHCFKGVSGVSMARSWDTGSIQGLTITYNKILAEMYVERLEILTVTLEVVMLGGVWVLNEGWKCDIGY